MTTPNATLFLRSPLFERHGVVHGFSIRTGGVSREPYASLDLGGSASTEPNGVETNHQRLADAVGVERSRLATAHQVHGDAVVLASYRDGRTVIRPAASSSSPVNDDDGALSFGDHPSGALQADAVIATSGTVAGVRTADCVPILLFDTQSGLAAAVHAGWRGTVARIVVKTVEALREIGGSAPGNWIAAIGPCIGRCCFEVSPDLAERFESDPAFGPACVEHRPGARPHVDLVEANARLLVAAGIPERSIDRLMKCTSCEPELFFSHRRDNGRTGRHLSIVAAAPTS